LLRPKAQKKKVHARLVFRDEGLPAISRSCPEGLFDTQQLADPAESQGGSVIASVDADNAAVDTAQTNLDYTSDRCAQRRMGVRLVDPETPCTLPIQSRLAR
jgi:membrane fusion protein, multidrug efflux system